MSKYIVLTESSVSDEFNNHSLAFAHCEGLKPQLCKAVYLVLSVTKTGKKVLGALNVSGGFDSQYMMEQIHANEFDYQVI